MPSTIGPRPGLHRSVEAAWPRRAGLYRPEFEHDACGVAFVADLHGRPSHAMVEMGLASLCQLEHRGAKGADPATGDGAGLLVQVPDRFLRSCLDVELPAARLLRHRDSLPARRRRGGRRCLCPLRRAGRPRKACRCWRGGPCPSRPGLPGAAARAVMPVFRQVVVAGPAGESGLALDRRAYLARKRAEHEIPGLYFASLSARTLVYKGMLTAPQLGKFYHDLSDPLFESGLALAHARFSTNTFPSWPLAHPYRYVAHNGEFNTVQGNRNWMRTREAMLASDLFPGDLSRIFPIVTPGRQRLDELRRGAGAAAPERPVAASRGVDDGARGVGEQGRPVPRRAGPSTSSTPA